jgi:alkylation response protein AidB-like acyl-CoA dehydrogenase
VFDEIMTDEQRVLRDEVRDFVARGVPRELIRDMDADKVLYPRSFLEEAARRGLLGLRFPESVGGRGLTWTSEMVALEEIGILGTALGCLYSLPIIVGEAIVQFGTEDQMERYLKPTLKADLTCAEALTEPRGGSDFFGATTRARRDGDYYILSGQKRFVVGSEGADYFFVYAKTDPEAPPRRSLSAFLVDRDMGVVVEHRYGLLGSRGGGTGRIVFPEIKVPVRNRVGEEGQGGDIFYRMMIPERLTSTGGALGMGRAALEIATRYSTRRKAFGRTIRKFQGVSFKVADGITQLDAARGLAYAAAKAADTAPDTGRTRRLVSEAKKFATEAGWKVINDAMQILGGIGYTSVYPLERLLRDARLILIWTGTNEVMNLIIQHEYYDEIETAIGLVRNVEADAPEADLEAEKVYE